MNILKNIININDRKSISTKIRQENFKIFKNLVSSFGRKVKVLDIGGTQEYWEMMEYTDPNLIEVVLINIDEIQVSLPNFRAIKKNALELDINGFDCDIVFSHSLIEHVDHERFAQLISDSKKPYFIQTPNKYFPIEPHFLIPLFQFMPLWLKLYLTRNSSIKNEVETINLLSKGDLKRLFPNSKIFGGKIFGLVQSFIVVKYK